MDISLVIAMLAFLALLLLPVLDHIAKSGTRARGLRAYLMRAARWVKE